MTSPVPVQDVTRRWPTIVRALGGAAFLPFYILVMAWFRNMSSHVSPAFAPYIIAGTLALAFVPYGVPLLRSLRVGKRSASPNTVRHRPPITPFQKVLIIFGLFVFGLAGYQALFNFDLYADVLRAESLFHDALIGPWAILIFLCLVQFTLFFWVELIQERP